MTRAIAFLVAALVLLIGASPAHANDPVREDVELVVTTITPEQLNGSEEVTVVGTLTNKRETAITAVQAQWHYSEAPITNSSELDAAVASDEFDSIAGRTTVTTELDAGETAQFSVSVPASAIAATREEIATVVGLEFSAVLVDSDKQEAAEPVAATRLLLPHTKAPRELSDVVLLTATPARLPGSSFVPETLQDEITTRLHDAVGALDKQTAVIDPAVYVAATTLAEREPEAAAFVDEVHKLRDAGRLWRLPYGNPNIGRLPEDIVADLPAWIDSTTPEALAGLPTVALTPGEEPLAGFDETITFGADPAVRRLQRLTDDARPRVLSELPPIASGNAHPTEQEPWPEVEEVLTGIDQFPEWRDELAGPVDEAQVQALRLAARSTNFATEADAVAYLNRSPLTSFDPGKISLSVSPSFVMTERTSKFPATVSNQTSMPISVRVSFTSDNPQRIDVDSTNVFTVGAGESYTVLVRPKAEVNGATMVHAQLESASGRKFGEVNSTEITATDFGRVGWIIIIASGVVVLAGTAWRIRNVRREKAKESSESGQ